MGSVLPDFSSWLFPCSSQSYSHVIPVSCWCGLGEGCFFFQFFHQENIKSGYLLSFIGKGIFLVNDFN